MEIPTKVEQVWKTSIDQEEVMSHKVNRWKKILFVPVLGVLLPGGRRGAHAGGR